jgi:hypothetical protein
VPGTPLARRPILGSADLAKKGKEIEIKLIARLRRHLGNPKFTALGERLESRIAMNRVSFPALNS